MVEVKSVSAGQWLRPPGAAAYLGVSQSFLAKARCSGTGPAFTRRGRLVLYARDSLDRWAGEATFISTAAASEAERRGRHARRVVRREG